MLRAASVVVLAASSLAGSNHHHRLMTASGYTHLPATCVHSSNIELHKGKTVAECAAICDANPSCLAFEYGVEYGGGGPYEAGDCQEQSSAEVTDCSGTYNNLDLYVKDGGTTGGSSSTTGSFTFQAGSCYPQSEAPVINTVNHMSSTLRRTGTPQECYDYCTGNSAFIIMGLDLRPTGGQDCKVAEDDYNDGRDCKRRAVTSTAVEDMDWSSMIEDYVCFTETFDADAELSELCGDVVSDAAGSSSSNGKDSDNEGHLLMILIILPTLLLAVIAWAILVMIKRRKLAKLLFAAAPPAHEPTPLSPSTLASIEASNLKMMGMRSEEPPQAAEPVAEAILPQGHVTGAEAAAMAEGEPPPQPSAGWGRRSLQRLASWRAGEEPPPPPAAEVYAPEAEC